MLSVPHLLFSVCMYNKFYEKPPKFNLMGCRRGRSIEILRKQRRVCCPQFTTHIIVRKKTFRFSATFRCQSCCCTKSCMRLFPRNVIHRTGPWYKQAPNSVTMCIHVHFKMQFPAKTHAHTRKQMLIINTKHIFCFSTNLKWQSLSLLCTCTESCTRLSEKCNQLAPGMNKYPQH